MRRFVDCDSILGFASIVDAKKTQICANIEEVERNSISYFFEEYLNFDLKNRWIRVLVTIRSVCQLTVF